MQPVFTLVPNVHECRGGGVKPSCGQDRQVCLDRLHRERLAVGVVHDSHCIL
jgi:hypothetical protein